MTTCQDCHQREAVLHLTEVAGELITTLHLCSQCASARGIVTDATTTPLGAFLATISPTAGMPDSPNGETLACPECDATLASIRASGRVGCPTCWVAFGRPLRELVRRLHGATRHVGDRYEDPATLTDEPARQRQREVDQLRRALTSAVEGEEFEEAAVLRDRLKALEGEG
ncbi:MAG: UvrB/UvrC motif-containing protein [Gemmatimonadota bacterium]